MKLIISIFTTFSMLIVANAQTYKSDFRADVCECLEIESQKRTLTENAYKACLREMLPKYAEEIDAQIVEEDINKKFHLGQLARKELLFAISSELIYKCDVYFQHLDYQRTSQKLIARENAKEHELEKYNQMVALTPNAMAYFMRAKLHFNLGNIEATEADVNKSLELNPNRDNVKSTRHELLLLAFVYEEQERFSDAVKIYDDVYFGDLDTQVARLRALANKKAGGTMSTIPKTEKSEVTKANSAITNRENTQRNRNSNTKNASRRTLKPRIEKKKDSSSIRKLFKIDNG
ncbi:tetratricopeptide repeat protein [Winogradskyella bathintestinalis]|uniref:Tetratricopeptide repeat protein n=1 Tax=Winogradskyella bathintestinalis TaxID=3035208 RepID=A0ABT7ZW01_9FLAO|nr:hypothetical protein [Winogradskyella bathintestinalis]MDN3493121.1 hypothetical protein [Winogradskyella bathintestinalis]